jgi:subtilisin family serine protease
LDKNNKLAYFSNYGDEVLFGAPGVNIYSSWK